MTGCDVVMAAIAAIAILLAFTLAGTNDYQSSVAWQAAWEEQNEVLP